MNVDSWTEKQWDPIFEENDACVMTAQVFLDSLRHGYIKLSQAIIDQHLLTIIKYNKFFFFFFFRST
jgi:hypothetical protein